MFAMAEGENDQRKGVFSVPGLITAAQAIKRRGFRLTHTETQTAIINCDKEQVFVVDTDELKTEVLVFENMLAEMSGWPLSRAPLSQKGITFDAALQIAKSLGFDSGDEFRRVQQAMQKLISLRRVEKNETCIASFFDVVSRKVTSDFLVKGCGAAEIAYLQTQFPKGVVSGTSFICPSNHSGYNLDAMEKAVQEIIDTPPKDGNAYEEEGSVINILQTGEPIEGLEEAVKLYDELTGKFSDINGLKNMMHTPAGSIYWALYQCIEVSTTGIKRVASVCFPPFKGAKALREVLAIAYEHLPSSVKYDEKKISKWQVIAFSLFMRGGLFDYDRSAKTLIRRN